LRIIIPSPEANQRRVSIIQSAREAERQHARIRVRSYTTNLSPPRSFFGDVERVALENGLSIVQARLSSKLWTYVETSDSKLSSHVGVAKALRATRKI